MDANPEATRRIAQRILSLERNSLRLDASPGAAFAVCEKLRTSLLALAGVAGFRALIARALSLAVSEVKWLGTVTVDPQGSLRTLEITADLPADEIERGEAALIAQLVRLLITFIGETLTLRLLQEAWPEVSRNDMSSGPETDE